MTELHPVLRRLGMTTPIVQAPMAGVSTPALAAAVSEAGGLGSLGLGAMSVEAARAAIHETRRLTGRPFSVNLFCHRAGACAPDHAAAWLEWLRPEFARYDATPPESLREIYLSFLDNDAMLTMLAEERLALVSFHFGAPSTHAADVLRRSGALLATSVTGVLEAQAADAAGMDVLIAQGYEAGGHRGVFDPQGPDRKLSLHALLGELSQATSTPLFAAGGLMNGRDIAAAMAAGACAAQLGTAFVAADESAASPAYRKALAGSGGAPEGDVTMMTSAISGRPARCLVNRFTALGARDDRPATPPYPYAYDAGKALDAAARTQGESGYGAFWAGTGARRSRFIPTAQLVATLTREWRAGEAESA